MVGIEIDDTFVEQISKTALAHAVQLETDQVAAKLVDGDLKDKFRGLGGFFCVGRCNREYAEEVSSDEFANDNDFDTSM